MSKNSGVEILVADLNAKSSANAQPILEKLATRSYERSRENPNPRTKLIFDLRNAGFMDLAHKAMDGHYL